MKARLPDFTSFVLNNFIIYKINLILKHRNESRNMTIIIDKFPEKKFVK